MYNSNYGDFATIDGIMTAFVKSINNMSVLNNVPDITLTRQVPDNPKFRTWYTVSFKNEAARNKFMAMNAQFGLGRLSDTDFDKRVPSANHLFIFRDLPNVKDVVAAILEVFPKL